MRICFASGNQDKVKELNDMLGFSFEIIGLKSLGITEEIPETGKTLEENSAIKARYVFDRHQMPVFADDSGLLVDALSGAPGVYSARYAGPRKNNEKNIDLVLENLGNQEPRTAQFKTIITFIDEKGNETQFKGAASGKIIKERRGKNGFGYDPIFIPDGFNLTFAEMSAKEKNQISHRYQAVRLLISHLQSLA